MIWRSLRKSPSREPCINLISTLGDTMLKTKETKHSTFISIQKDAKIVLMAGPSTPPDLSGRCGFLPRFGCGPRRSLSWQDSPRGQWERREDTTLWWTQAGSWGSWPSPLRRQCPCRSAGTRSRWSRLGEERRCSPSRAEYQKTEWKKKKKEEVLFTLTPMRWHFWHLSGSILDQRQKKERRYYPTQKKNSWLEDGV